MSCSATLLRAELSGYIALHSIPITYKEFWVKDIDRGLKAWPGVSHKVALALFYNEDRKTKTKEARAILDDYANDHLISMAGAPDFVGLSRKTIQKIVGAIMPEALQKAVDQMISNLANTMVKNAVGMSLDEMKEYLEKPDVYFDDVVAASSGADMSLKDFNQKMLGLRDAGYNNPAESFDYKKVPAAYNTVVMSKLVLMSPEAINQMMQDLGGEGRLKTENIMLGFIETLDGSAQWNPDMILAGENCSVYEQLLMPLPKVDRRPALKCK
jgi:hypothetical protein